MASILLQLEMPLHHDAEALRNIAAHARGGMSAHLLHGLVAGHGAQGVHVRLAVQQRLQNCHAALSAL